ncbi:hypothetical protein SAMN04490243_2167 [Robiginitalea myxolifaciens]|uniref:Succinylglutamate desuccinylase/Aspartoacylase catalytic domain-containing protein n=1 Tax=Robiginitalea myxolifaciens TaxID=400055 RepID=A0A1I6H304_9FLAO|nr:M14 family metallopeptidase [Robiginitalea myxolifaciens]SFR48800.1 hypothetical protein SAMN04490243_2167 [Robiginitalea myxolifaciens]
MRLTYVHKSILKIVILLFCFTASAQVSFTEKYQSTQLSSVEKFTIDFRDSLDNEISLPVVIIRGKEAGPTLTVLAGVHGYEYPPIIAVQEILKEIVPEQLSGTLILSPVTNTGAFYGRALFINPADGVNLNRSFPGDSQGTVTQQIAHYITTNIIPVSDVFLDIHGGDASEDLVPFVCYYNHEGKSAQTALAAVLSERSGFPNVVSYPYTLKDSEPAKYVFKQAVQDGKVGLSFEAGLLGNVQEGAVALNKNGIYNVMRELGMYETDLVLPTVLNRYNDQVYVRVPQQGIFYSNLRAGDRVDKDQEIGYITDEFGEKLEKIKAPASGLILYKIGTPPVKTGETLMCIGIPEE